MNRFFYIERSLLCLTGLSSKGALLSSASENIRLRGYTEGRFNERSMIGRSSNVQALTQEDERSFLWELRRNIIQLVSPINERSIYFPGVTTMERALVLGAH